MSVPEERGVAVVTGATRGVGRGVAVALGAAGMVVYVTGRSTRGSAGTEDLPGTVEETAEAVDAAGGLGMPVVCDQSDDEAVAALFGRVRAEHGRLDVLVNSAWSGYERSDEVRFDAPFWDQPLWRWDLFQSSLRGTFAACRAAAAIMVPADAGLIVNVGFSGGETYLGQVPYDVAKNGTDRMSFGMARDLRRTGVVVLALHPGLVRTERVEAAWEALGDGPAAQAHSPEYVGRAVVALLADPDLADLAGRAVAVGDLAAQHGFDDVDGRRPPAFRLEGRMSLATRMERLNRVVRTTAGGPTA